LFFNNTAATKLNKAIILLAISMLLLSGCSQNNNNQKPTPRQQSAQDGQQPDEIPEELKAIEGSIEKIIKSLGGPAVAVEGEEQPAEEQGGESQDKGGQKEGKKEEGQQSQGGNQKQVAQPPQPESPWEKITPTINTLHYQWNAYMPSAVKMGAKEPLVGNFGDALNRLTGAIIEKDKNKALMAASHLYAYIPDFYSLYKARTSPEIKRLRHYTRNAMLNAMTANWTQADEDISSLKSSWALLKNTLSKDQQQDSNKLDFSIYELEKVVKERNTALSNIKGKVTMANIEAIEKSAEKQTGQEGSE